MVDCDDEYRPNFNLLGTNKQRDVVIKFVCVVSVACEMFWCFDITGPL